MRDCQPVQCRDALERRDHLIDQSSAWPSRREQGELQGQDLWPGGRDHPPDADQRRTRRLHPDPLEPISEPQLDAASETAWHLAASPNQIDTIEYAYLEGQQGAYIETRNGFDVDGVEIKCRLDFGAKAIDWRGLYKNPGA